MTAVARRLVPATLLAVLLALPAALAAQASRASVVRRPGVILGSGAVAARPGVIMGAGTAARVPETGAVPGDVAGAVADDLRRLARRRGWEERLEEPRIVRLAEVIAAESAHYDLPPALLIAIIHLESEYNAAARSPVGATGLMQVMPSWPGDLGYRFGTNLRDEATNVRYGTWVLQDALSYTGGDPERALLRYNGCRTGKNTPGCFRYPDRIRALVEEVAPATCRGRGWEACVAEPLRTTYQRDL